MILARLSGRSLDSMKQRAKRLGCVLRPHWTAREDRVLRMEGGWCSRGARCGRNSRSDVVRHRAARAGARARLACARPRLREGCGEGVGLPVLGLYGVIQRQV